MLEMNRGYGDRNIALDILFAYWGLNGLNLERRCLRLRTILVRIRDSVAEYDV